MLPLDDMKLSKLFVCVLMALLVVGVVACGSNAAGSTSNEAVGDGQLAYELQCQSCHGDAATGQGALPNTPTHDVSGHTWHHADGQLKEIILGRLQIPGRTMPSFEGVLSEEETDEVLAYLKTNWLPEQRSSQAEASRNWEQLQSNSQ